MNRGTRTIIVVAIAVAVAALASFGAYQAIKRMPVREVEVRSLYQVVAARDMAMGTMLTKDHVKLVPWPASSPVAKGFTSIDKVVDRGLIASVNTNEPITENKLAPLEAGAGLPPLITEGMRAMSVRVNDVVGVAGFVVPGTHVDVMVVFKPEGSKDNISKVVLSDVQVLTAGTKVDQEKARDGQAMQSSVVTLLLKPEDAEKLSLATHEGSIVLTLRNPMDRMPTETNGARTAALLGKQAPPPAEKPAPRRTQAAAPPPPPPAPTPSKIYTVEAIRAAKRSEEVVR